MWEASEDGGTAAGGCLAGRPQRPAREDRARESQPEKAPGSAGIRGPPGEAQRAGRAQGSEEKAGYRGLRHPARGREPRLETPRNHFKCLSKKDKMAAARKGGGWGGDRPLQGPRSRRDMGDSEGRADHRHGHPASPSALPWTPPGPTGGLPDPEPRGEHKPQVRHI